MHIDATCRPTFQIIMIMDPSRPESFNHRTENLSTGRTYHFVDQVPEGYSRERTPTLLCIHGFPDLWYGWRSQIGPWANRGYRVIAPDMLGYGGSSKPQDAVEYTTKRLCADLAALLDLLDIGKAVVIGHDWGAFIAARFALWHPDRLHALVLLSVPYRPPGHYQSLEMMVKLAPHLGYQLYFADPRSDTEILNQLKNFLTLVFADGAFDHTLSAVGTFEAKLLKPDKARGFLTDKELDYYYVQHSQNMHGPLNYYRTTEFRYKEESAANLGPNLPDDLPVLFLRGTLDTVTTSLVDNAKDFIKLYETVKVEGRGHWLMIEAKDEVTERIANWLDGLTLRSWGSAKL